MRQRGLLREAPLLQQPTRTCKLRPQLGERHVANALVRLRRGDRGLGRDDELDVAAALGEEEVAGPQGAKPTGRPTRNWSHDERGIFQPIERYAA